MAFRKYHLSWFLVFCLAAILAILVCNAWQLCCGRCVLNDFLRIPPIGWVLIIANLIAGLVLTAVKRRDGKKTATDRCSACNTALRDTWIYCPSCGEERHPQA
jgi:hypothetical protein